MTHSDDPMHVLRRFLTEDHADRILTSVSDSVSGSVSAEDEDLAPMANLLAALQTPATPDELSGQENLLAQMRAAMQSTSAARLVSDASAAIDLAVDDAGLIDLLPSTALPRRNTMLAKIVTGKVAALAAVGIFSVGAAAAATGTLPSPMQRTVSNAASQVGLDLPEPSRRLGDSSFRSSTSDDSSASSTSVSSPVSAAVSSTVSSAVSSTSTVTTLPSSASPVASAVNSRCEESRDRSDDSSSSTSTSAPTRVCSDESTSTSGPSNTVTSIDDHGGDRDRSGSDDNSGSGSGSSGRSSGRNGSDDDSTSTSGPSNTVTSIDDHGGDRDRTSSTTPSSSPATVTSIDDRGGNSGRGSGSSGSGSGSSGSRSNSGKG